MIKLIRSDDRLIHGQCVTQIVKLYAIQHILVIDDFTATNPFLKRIFEKAVPSNITAEALTFDQAISAARKAVDNEVSTLILMKTPLVMQRLLEAVEDLPKDLNIASLAAGQDRTAVTKYAYLTPREISAVKQMSEDGVHIWFSLIPTSPCTEWDSIKTNY